MRTSLSIAGLALALVLSSCSMMMAQQEQVQKLTSGPVPAAVQDRASVCQQIHTLQAKMHEVLADRANSVEAPFTSAADRRSAAEGLGALDARDRQLNCASVPAELAALPVGVAPATTAGGPASAAPAAIRPLTSGEDFERCFQRCRSYTDRSKEQCFDICNR